MNDPAFLFYPGDYLRDTQCLSEKSQVAYDRIMCEHMRNICVSQEQLNFFTKKLSDEEKQELLFVLTKCDNGYFIKWVAESIEKRREYSESRRNNRLKKEITHDKDMKTYDSHMEDENEDVNKNENKSVIKKEKLQINFPEDFTERRIKIFQAWLEYKKQIKDFYKSEMSIIALFHKWKDKSDPDLEKIVLQSISNNWKGLFELRSTDLSLSKKERGDIAGAEYIANLKKLEQQPKLENNE